MTGSPIAWAAATLALAGESVSGDRHVVKPVHHGTLVAVVDGLGHGREAAAAADLAVAMLETYNEETITTLVGRCHKRLTETRGVVMSLALFNPHDATMTWMGVGNIEGWFFHVDADGKLQRESLLLRGGVVGGQVPLLTAAAVPVSPGDTLIFATDGIRSDFDQGVLLSDSPQGIATGLLAKYGKGTDDALVLVARYLGPQP